eukprot:362691-Chlamydomonas_euryale.AAC.3
MHSARACVRQLCTQPCICSTSSKVEQQGHKSPSCALMTRPLITASDEQRLQRCQNSRSAIQLCLALPSFCLIPAMQSCKGGCALQL